MTSNPIAAVRLGFHSRYIGLDCLQESLVALNEEISLNVFSLLQNAIEQADRAIDEWEQEPNELAQLSRRYRTRRRWKPDFVLAHKLATSADKAIALTSPNRAWYNLGAALGEYTLCLTTEKERLERDGRLVIDCLRALPTKFLSLLGIDNLAGPSADYLPLDRSLERWLERARSNATPLTYNPDSQIAIKFLDAIILGIQQTPPLPPRSELTSTRRIAPANRTIPMSFKKAARLMGKGSDRAAAKWLSASVRDGSTLCERKSRQMHVFDKHDFPKNAWAVILPK